MNINKIEKLKKQYDDLHCKGHLSEKGLDFYILLLKNQVKDYSERINQTNNIETKADLKDAEKVRLASKRD